MLGVRRLVLRLLMWIDRTLGPGGSLRALQLGNSQIRCSSHLRLLVLARLAVLGYHPCLVERLRC